MYISFYQWLQVPANAAAVGFHEAELQGLQARAAQLASRRASVASAASAVSANSSCTSAGAGSSDRHTGAVQDRQMAAGSIGSCDASSEHSLQQRAKLSESTRTNAATVEHAGYTCDGCGTKPIVGEPIVRFRHSRTISSRASLHVHS
eukprot:SAG31_NODE_864_length_11392_cov_21.929868_8_plen_148_part_00